MPRKSHRSARLAAYNTPAALARRKASNEARSIAGPAPVYPDAARPGQPTGEYIEAFWRGQFVRLELGRPYPPSAGKRPRCDQASVLVGDQVLIDAAGLTAIFDDLRAQLTARAPSLRAMVAMQQGYSARDEADAEADRPTPRSAARPGEQEPSPDQPEPNHDP